MTVCCPRDRPAASAPTPSLAAGWTQPWAGLGAGHEAGLQPRLPCLPCLPESFRPCLGSGGGPGAVEGPQLPVGLWEVSSWTDSGEGTLSAPPPRPCVRSGQVLEAQAHGKPEPQTDLVHPQPAGRRRCGGRSMTRFFSWKLRPSGLCQGYRELGVAPGTQPGAPLGQAAPPPTRTPRVPSPASWDSWRQNACAGARGGSHRLSSRGDRREVRFQSHLQMSSGSPPVHPLFVLLDW